MYDMSAASLVTEPDLRPRRASRAMRSGVCTSCRRETALTFHHLIPRKMHRRRFFQKRYKKAQLQQGVYLCRLCHDGVHRRFDEMTLAKCFNTPAKLFAEPSLTKHFQWVGRQKVR